MAARIAVTGGIACGKSLVGGLLSDTGVAVCEADLLAHHVMRPDGCAYAQVVEAFGDGILASDGVIERKLLGQIVFSDTEKREALNRIVHPKVAYAWQQWLREQSKKVCAVIVPLLYESGNGEGWDQVVCVNAPEELQIERMKERGLSRVNALDRIEAQMPQAEKAKRADFVIVNSGSRRLLKSQVIAVLDRILEK